jgi:2-iminobutanoate/2-iminopropanoate deaminase
MQNYFMKKCINTSKAPAPIGPYSQAILSGNTLYISGQIGMNPASGALVTGDITGETRQVMENLRAILSKATMDFDQVVKASIFIRDMNQFSAINEVYATYFTQGPPPARETVEVSNLPRSVNVEISMIAVK